MMFINKTYSMSTITQLRRLLALFLVVLFFGQIDVQAQSADQLIQRVQEKYNSIDALRAEFSQTMRSAYSEGEETFSGTLVLQGDKYRVETTNQTLVTNGVVTWIYNASENQVLVNDAVEDETSFSINDFLFNFSDHYTATGTESVTLGGEKHFKINLKPKSPDSFFQDVTVWLRDRDTIITRLEVLDMNETTMLFNLTNIQLNPEVNATTFTFQPPKTAEVIDLRS